MQACALCNQIHSRQLGEIAQKAICETEAILCYQRKADEKGRRDLSALNSCVEHKARYFMRKRMSSTRRAEECKMEVGVTGLGSNFVGCLLCGAYSNHSSHANVNVAVKVSMKFDENKMRKK